MRARWVEAETLHLKRMGLSFEEIAEQITRVGRGQANPILAATAGINFPQNYSISRAFRRAIAREPALAVDELRKPRRHDLTGKDGKPLTLVQLLEAVGPISDEDEESKAV